MIKYLENGGNYSKPGCGIYTTYSEIPKEEYIRLSAMNRLDVNKEIQEGLPEHILCGYGYYGYRLEQQSGRYFLGINIGTSCD